MKIYVKHIETTKVLILVLLFPVCHQKVSATHNRYNFEVFTQDKALPNNIVQGHCFMNNNPGILFLHTTHPLEKMRIQDMNGRLVFESHEPENSGVQLKFTFPGNGIYIVNANSANLLLTGKFLKN